LCFAEVGGYRIINGAKAHIAIGPSASQILQLPQAPQRSLATAPGGLLSNEDSKIISGAKQKFEGEVDKPAQ